MFHAATLSRNTGAGVIDENPSHHLCREREKVIPVVVGHGSRPQQAKREFVHQRCRVERMISPFLPQEARGDLPQLRVRDGKELVAGINISTAPCSEPFREVLRIRRPPSHQLMIRIDAS